MTGDSLESLQTPALLIRLDRVRHNIAAMLEQAGGVDRWRPHVKTSKIPQVFDLLLDAGVRQFKCATTREAAVLLGRSSDPIDLLVAYPHRARNLARLAELAAEHNHHRLSVLTESADHAREVLAASPALSLFVDLDPGYHRTGIPLAETERLTATLQAAGERLRGLHYYDGHIHEDDVSARANRCAAVYDDLMATLSARQLEPAEIITSGTPTYRHALAYRGFDPVRHRVSPGTIVYSDLRTEQLGVDGFARAAHVLARVISTPGGRRVTCDAGSKAVDAAAGNPCAEVEGWPDLTAQVPSEEHLPLAVGTAAPPASGTLVQLVPLHVCPTVNLADEAVLLDDERIVDVVPVAARGHETR